MIIKISDQDSITLPQTSNITSDHLSPVAWDHSKIMLAVICPGQGSLLMWSYLILIFSIFLSKVLRKPGVLENIYNEPDINNYRYFF
jgi:hypothetical protein